jgi:mannose-6-phosphate isomerase-like protein (cupin superfamily)
MKVYNPDTITGTNEYGGTVKIIINDKTPSNLSSGIFTLKPGEALVPDIHQSDEVFYIVSGQLTLRDGEKTEEYKVPAGSMVWIPKGQVHLSSNENEEDVVILWTNGCS